jgi:hypothetical protein
MSKATWLGNFAQWGSVIAAILALAASGTIGYYTVLRQKEELTVEAYKWPAFGLTSELREFVDGKLGMLFINSGSRPIAIKDVRIVLATDGKDCVGEMSTTTDVAPFVVKANDIVRQEFSPVAVFDQSQRGTARVEKKAPPEVTKKPGWRYAATICARISATSPSETFIVGSIFSGAAVEQYASGAGGAEASTPNAPTRPKLIWRKIFSSFSD